MRACSRADSSKPTASRRSPTRLPLVDARVGAALLIARVNGLGRGHVRDKLSWPVSYAERLRAVTHHAAARCRSAGGLAIRAPLLVNIAAVRPGCAHTAFQHVQDPAGGLLVTHPAPEHLAHPEYGAALRRYPTAAGGVSGAQRLRILNLISDLTAACGGDQAVLAIHAEGSIEAEKLTIPAQYDRESSIHYASRLAGLELGEWPPSRAALAARSWRDAPSATVWKVALQRLSQPDALHRTAKTRAAAACGSLSAYVKRELVDVGGQESIEDLDHALGSGERSGPKAGTMLAAPCEACSADRRPRRRHARRMPRRWRALGAGAAEDSRQRVLRSRRL